MFNTQDSPPINGENKKIRSFRKGALHRLRVKLNLQSKITLIKFASGDYARKYLVDEPLLARKGQHGYDPNVEREVNAALTHGRPLSEAGKIKLGKERGRTVFTKLGIHFKKTKEGKRIIEPGQRVTPYQSLKSGISRQQKDLTAIPKPTPPEELPPPEILSHHNTKLPNRGMSYEGHDVPDLWNREEAGKPSDVIHTYPGREKRKPFTPEEVSIKAREYRDPVASHKARVKAGLTPNLIVKREDKIAHLPSEYLPKAVDVEERRQAQAIRDNLAGKLKAIHKETIQPMRRLHPGLDLSPAVLNRAHQTLRSKIGEVTSGHVQAAEKIKQGVNDRILKRLAGDQKREGKGLRGDALSGHLTKYNAIKDSSNRLTNEVFNQRRTSIEGDLARVPKGLRGQPGLEDWEVKAIADHAGVTPDKIKKLHKSFVNHTRLGTTQGGEDQIRKSLTKKVLSGIPVTPEKAVKHTYPAFKTLGKVGAIGAGLLGAGYAARRIFGKKKEFSADKPLKDRTIKLIGKNRLALSGVRNNGIILADVSRWRPVINFVRGDILKKMPGFARNIPNRGGLIQRKMAELLAAYANKSKLIPKLEGPTQWRPGKGWTSLSVQYPVINLGIVSIGTAKKVLRSVRQEHPGLKMMRPTGVSMAIGHMPLSLKRKAINKVPWVRKQQLSSMGPVISFKRDDKPRPSILAHAATGGVEGAAGIYAIDPLLEKFKHGGKMVNPFKDSALGHTKKIAIGGIVGALATAPIGALVERYRLKRKLRENANQLRLSSTLDRVLKFSSLSELNHMIDVAAETYKKLRKGHVRNPFFKENNIPAKVILGLNISGNGVERRIPIRKVISHQETIDPELVAKYSGSPKDQLPRVHKIGGEYLIQDGNHSIAAKKSTGSKSVKVKVLSSVKLSAMNKIMNFESQRTIVGKDRYVKQIKEKDLSSARHNYAGSAIAGAAVAALLRKKSSLGNAALTGAGAGLAVQGATRIGTAFTKDQFGERSWKSKRVDRAPWVAGGIAAAGLGLRKYAKGLHKFEIKFQQFIPAEGNGTSWHQREITRWLKHPKSRVENAQKWLSRAERINKDVGLTRTGGGKVIDDRGRERKAELSKDWVKRAIGGGIAVGALTGGALLKRRIGKSAAVAVGLREKGIHPSQWSQGERMSLNITSGNWGRAVRGKLKSMFPKFSGGMKKLSGLSEDVNQAKEAILRKGNKFIEGQTGQITNASFRRNKQNEIIGINIENPAEAKENLEKLQVQHDKVQKRLTQIRRQQDRVKETQGTRGQLEKIIKPPKDKAFISKSKMIQFQDEVYVRPHSRSPRRNKYTHEKKDFREGLLIGGGLGLGGLGVGSGMAYKASRQKFTEETEARVMKRLQEISAKNVASKAVKSGFKLLSSRLDDLIRLT